MSAGSWAIAWRDAETGAWRVSSELLTEEQATTRTRYLDEAVGVRALAVDLDSLEAHLRRGAA